MPVPDAADPRRLRLAYLVSQYPALSHAFIATEVEALRRAGAAVTTFSIRPSGIADDPENAGTLQVLAQPRSVLLAAMLRLALRRPRALLSGVRAAWRNGRGRGARARTRQAFYLLEAVPLHGALRRRGLRHVHVHFGNNAADVARLVVAIGAAVDGPSAWSWSLTVHGPTELERAEEYGLAAKVASAAFCVCITDYCRAEIRRRTPEAVWPRLHVVRVGIPRAVLAAAGEPRDGGRAADEPMRVLFVGRLVSEKGPDVLLEAVDRVCRDPASRVALTLVGDGPLRADLEARARHLPPAADVRFLGGLPNREVLSWYRWADVFCLPSLAEGLPVVLMEALAHRLAVVTTPVAGIPELVVDGRTGVLVPPGRPDRLADALAALRADPAGRGRLGRAGRDSVLAAHDADSTVADLVELFAAVGPSVSGSTGSGE